MNTPEQSTSEKKKLVKFINIARMTQAYVDYKKNCVKRKLFCDESVDNDSEPEIIVKRDKPFTYTNPPSACVAFMGYRYEDVYYCEECFLNKVKDQIKTDLDEELFVRRYRVYGETDTKARKYDKNDYCSVCTLRLYTFIKYHSDHLDFPCSSTSKLV